jgi:CRISPR/Cas system CMR-associated protein Cmr5 small subunit
MPPNNVKLFRKKYPELECRPFFKHINIDVLNTIKTKDLDGYFYRWDIEDDDEKIKGEFGERCYSFPPTWTTNRDGMKVPLKYTESEHLFNYKNLIYRRRSYLSYEEQFGRLIFEYILLGKTVYFLNEKHTEDGLSDYLTHFNISFCVKKIITSKEELTERMERYDDKPWL